MVKRYKVCCTEKLLVDLQPEDNGQIIYFGDHIKELEKYKCCGNCKYCKMIEHETHCYVWSGATHVDANDKCENWELR